MNAVALLDKASTPQQARALSGAELSLSQSDPLVPRMHRTAAASSSSEPARRRTAAADMPRPRRRRRDDLQHLRKVNMAPATDLHAQKKRERTRNGVAPVAFAGVEMSVRALEGGGCHVVVRLPACAGLP
jgi:hypothetical protein